MSVGDPGGTPFKIPLTSTAGSGGSSAVSGTKSEPVANITTAANAPFGDSGTTSQLVVTKTYIGGDDDGIVVFHSFNLAASPAPATSTDVVNEDGFEVKHPVYVDHGTDTHFDGGWWDSHSASSSSDWSI